MILRGKGGECVRFLFLFTNVAKVSLQSFLEVHILSISVSANTDAEHIKYQLSLHNTCICSVIATSCQPEEKVQEKR